MDHLEDEQERTTGQQQEQSQQRRQGRQPQQPQQQWQQQGQGYAAAQQAHFPAQITRQQFPGQQEMPPAQGGTALMQPPQGDIEYRTEQQAPASTVSYPMHPTTTASYAGYPQHYQPAVQQQQMYHHQAQMALQQPIHIQQQPMAGVPVLEQQHAPQQPYIQPTAGRLPSDRPLVKLSVSLIDTYKQINRVYYEERDARRAARAAQKAQKGQGANNNGWDDENHDYIVSSGEMFYGRYVIKERIGKGSFGQVVRAIDSTTNKDVAIKIIKSKRPFLLQAKTEIELLSHLFERDPDDQHNIGKRGSSCESWLSRQGCFSHEPPV